MLIGFIYGCVRLCGLLVASMHVAAWMLLLPPPIFMRMDNLIVEFSRQAYECTFCA